MQEILGSNHGTVRLCSGSIQKYDTDMGRLLVWFVPSFIIAAVSVSIIGILLGPMHPIALNHTALVVPRHLVDGTVVREEALFFHL